MRWLNAVLVITFFCVLSSAVNAHIPVSSSLVIRHGPLGNGVGVGASSNPIITTPGTDSTSVVSSMLAPSNVSHSSGMSFNEALMVLKGGREYDSKSRVWGFREPMKGARRENFLLSWQKPRIKIGGTGVQGVYAVSSDLSDEAMNSNYIRFD